MQWASLESFWAMDGYGAFIWGAYGLTLLCVVVEPWLSARRLRRALRDAAPIDMERS